MISPYQKFKRNVPLGERVFLDKFETLSHHVDGLVECLRARAHIQGADLQTIHINSIRLVLE